MNLEKALEVFREYGYYISLDSDKVIPIQEDFYYSMVACEPKAISCFEENGYEFDLFE